VPSSQTNDKVTVSTKSLEDVLAALQTIADNIAANTAAGAGTNGGGSGGNGGGGGGGGGGSTGQRVPNVVQSRVILDYLALGELLARVGLTGRIVSASRECEVIRLRRLPTTSDGAQVATHALVTPGGGGDEQLAQLEPDPEIPDDPDNPANNVRLVTVNQIDLRQPIVRIELQDAAGVPIALGPRLAAVADPDDCDGVSLDRPRRSR
jgi:hypothetical protein